MSEVTMDTEEDIHWFGELDRLLCNWRQWVSTMQYRDFRGDGEYIDRTECQIVQSNLARAIQRIRSTP